MWKLATAQSVLGQPGHQLSLGSEKLHAAWMLAPGVGAGPWCGRQSLGMDAAPRMDTDPLYACWPLAWTLVPSVDANLWNGC